MWCDVIRLCSSSATELMTPKWALVLGASTYSCFIAANISPQAYARCPPLAARVHELMTSCVRSLGLVAIRWTLVPAAALSGLGAGLLWTGQGAYVSNVAANYARAMNKPKKSVLGLFNGIFFANMQVRFLSPYARTRTHTHTHEWRQ
jgi:hypothetical protein